MDTKLTKNKKETLEISGSHSKERKLTEFDTHKTGFEMIFKEGKCPLL